MLKIKDNVDLKELEKFGFLKWENSCGTTGYSKYFTRGSITIVEKDKEFDNKYNNERMIKDHDVIHDVGTIYDLIQAGIVEEVKINEI